MKNLFSRKKVVWPLSIRMAFQRKERKASKFWASSGQKSIEKEIPQVFSLWSQFGQDQPQKLLSFNWLQFVQIYNSNQQESIKETHPEFLG